MTKIKNQVNDFSEGGTYASTLTTSNAAGGQTNMDEVNKGYLTMNCFAISLGFMQFGIGMNSYSTLSTAFQYNFGWDDDNMTLINDMTQSSIILGAAIGALSCARFLALGKLRLLYILNIVLLIGVAISMIGQNVYILNVGRLIWGFAFGSFSVVCAKFINEIAPLELSGSLGAMNQMALTFGGCLPPLMSLAYPLTFDASTEDFYVKTYWRVIYCLPILISALQLCLITFCFRHETPIFLQEQGREEELLVVMKKYYSGMEVRRRLDALQGASKPKEGLQEAQEPSIYESFFDPRIRQSAWVGFWLATFQQWTGINAVIFYSAQLFGSTDGSGLSPTQVTVMINGANFLSAFGGAVLLGFFGRKTLMITM